MKTDGLGKRFRGWTSRLLHRTSTDSPSAKPPVVIHEDGWEIHNPAKLLDEPFKTAVREIKWVLHPHRNDVKWDGMLVGQGGKVYSPHMPLAGVLAATPQTGPAPTTAIYVNGINTPLKRQSESFQELADTLSVNIVGVHNATVNPAEDVRRIAVEEFRDHARPATTTLGELLESALRNHEPIQLIAHSGGGVTISEAVTLVRERYEERGVTGEALQALMSLMSVTTFGATGFEYPDGPVYRHWVNTLDVVPTQTGIGLDGQPLLPEPHPGNGAEIHRFTTNPLEDPHGIETYLRYYRAANEQPAMERAG